MDNNQKLTAKKCIKYIVFAGVTYAVLKVIPNRELTKSELIILIGTILVCIFSLDCLTAPKQTEQMTNSNKVFDLDLNVDLDFDKAKENLMETIENTEDDDKPEQEQDNEEDTDVNCQDEVNKMRKELETTITNLKKEKSSKGENCKAEVSKMRRDMEKTIKNLKKELKSKPSKDKFEKRYFDSLINEMLEKGLINQEDFERIEAKIASGISTTEEIVESLEKLKKLGKGKAKKPVDTTNDMKYSELPSEAYKPIGEDIANDWTNEYAILNTDKWQINQPKPPVCVGGGEECKVCPTNTAGYPTNLKEWDDSRKISNTKISQKWAQDQTDSKQS